MSDIDQDYHRERARAELDAARGASDGAVAKAHMGLSALHMRKLTQGGASHLSAVVQNDHEASAR